MTDQLPLFEDPNQRPPVDLDAIAENARKHPLGRGYQEHQDERLRAIADRRGEHIGRAATLGASESETAPAHTDGSWNDNSKRHPDYVAVPKELIAEVEAEDRRIPRSVRAEQARADWRARQQP